MSATRNRCSLTRAACKMWSQASRMRFLIRNQACLAFVCNSVFSAGKFARRSAGPCRKFRTTAHFTLLTAIAFLALAVPSLRSESSPSSGTSQLSSATATNLIAWWRFDEPSGEVCKDASGNGHDASPEPGQGAGLHRGDGLFDRARGRMVGSDEYLTKPFTKDGLLKTVATHAARP